MRLGLSSYSYRYAVSDDVSPMDTTEMIRQAAALGLDFLQICDNLPLDAMSESQLENVAAKSADLGLAVEVGTTGLDQGHLSRYVEIARMLGSRGLRLVLDTADVDTAIHRLRPIVPSLNESGITLAIENHFGLSANELATVVELLGSEMVRVCLDTANSVGLMERPLETASTLGHLACQVHLKDYVVEKAIIGYHVTGRILGEGWLDLDGLLGILGGRASTLDYMVELWMDPADSREETLAKEAHWIASSVVAARHLLDQQIGAEK